MATAADISWRGPAGTFNLTASGHRFRWVPVRELGSAGFQPAGLIPVLPDLTDALLPDLTDALLPDLTDALLPDLTDALLPDLTDALLPDLTDALLPDLTDAVQHAVAAP